MCKMNQDTTRLLLVAFTIGAVARGASSLDVCDPDCKGKEPGDMVADPMDCTQFYYCLNDEVPSNNPISCEDGFIFDVTSSSCVPGSECISQCNGKECHFTCDGTLEMVSDKFNCGQYYVCLPSGPKGYSCPDDRPFFNGETCVSKYECCSDPCVPYCAAAGSQIPDPKNCTMFYVCLEEGPPLEELHFQCPSGENFDVSLGFCYAGAPCPYMCTDPITTTTEETTTTVTTTPTTTPPDCSETFLCTDVGSFDKYPICIDEYFACYEVGVCAVHETCKEGTVFNPVPEYPYCIVAEMCPYTPATNV